VTSQIGNGGEPLDPRTSSSATSPGSPERRLVAEVSMPSTGVGYEIAAARYRYRIPVICLYRPAYTARCTAMVAGDDGVELIEYTDDTFDAMLETLVNKLTAAPVS
jgi:hypothetical protein